MSVPDRVPGEQLLGHTHAITCSHDYDDYDYRNSKYYVVMLSINVNKGKMTCHVGSSSMNHGEAEIASSSGGEGEMNSRGNRTSPGPSLTAAAEPKRSGRLTVVLV